MPIKLLVAADDFTGALDLSLIHISLWKLLNISNDRFIRTTDDYHVRAVQKIFRCV